MAKSKKKSNKLGLGDYKKILVYIKSLPTQELELIAKIKKKIDQLENPPERVKREKVQFKCTACEKKFKRAPIICPECEDDEHIVKLDQWA